jgi:hypothetical protein
MSAAAPNIFETQVLAHLRLFRGQAVILDSDLAWFLGVEAGTILAAVENNPEAFPDDFIFRLSRSELEGLRKESLCLTDGGLPPERDRVAFTTHGAGMLLVVLRDEKFALAAIPVLRAFANYWDEIERDPRAKPLVNRKL